LSLFFLGLLLLSLAGLFINSYTKRFLVPKHVFFTWLILFILLFSIPLFRKPKTSDQSSLPQEYSKSLVLLEAINNARAAKGLTVLGVDENLCAYAKRRALQYKEQSPVKGELLPLEESQEISTAYFKNFPKSTEAVLKVGLINAKQTADDFMQTKDKGVGKLALTHDCVAEEGSADGTGTWTVFIGGIQ